MVRPDERPSGVAASQLPSQPSRCILDIRLLEREETTPKDIPRRDQCAPGPTGRETAQEEAGV
jgi:hypothetical protein